MGALVTKPDWDAERGDPWESEESEEEDVVIDSEVDEMLLPSWPLHRGMQKQEQPQPAGQPSAREALMMREYMPAELIDTPAKVSKRPEKVSRHG